MQPDPTWLTDHPANRKHNAHAHIRLLECEHAHDWMWQQGQAGWWRGVQAGNWEGGKSFKLVCMQADMAGSDH